MDSKRTEASDEEAKGSLKEAIGKLSGNEKTEAEGAAEKASGKAKATENRAAHDAGYVDKR